MMGKWVEALHYLFPVIAFAMGVFVAERIQQKYKYRSRIHWRQIIVALEIAILFLVGFIPVQFNMAATMLVSFPAPCRFRLSEKFTVMAMPVPCASEIYGREQKVWLFI